MAIWLYCLIGYLTLVIWPMAIWLYYLIGYLTLVIWPMGYFIFLSFKFLGSNFFGFQFDTLGFSCLIILGFEGLMFIL
jgi:hypothetical protein